MAYTKGIYGDGAEGKKKKTAKTTTKSQPAVTTPKPAKPATVNVPAQSTNTARQEQRREQQYRAAKKPSAAAVPAQNTDDARQEQLQEQFYRQNQEQEQRIQRAKDLMAETARTEQLAARAQTRQETKPQGMESLAAAKQQAEKAWNDWLWDKGYNPNSPKGLEDFYRKAGISLPGTTKFDGKIPTVQQLYEAVQRGKAEELSAEAARKEQTARRERELEAFYEQMDREWYSDDPKWQESHRDADAARAEQRAAKDYREKQEKAQQAKDLSTQTAIDEKLAARKHLASQGTSGYTEKEVETQRFWERFLNNESFYSPYQDSWEKTIEKAYAENQKIEGYARKSNVRYKENARVFDAAGHINGQAHKSIGSMRFGNSDVATSGCGAIAVYNVLQDLGKTNISLSDVIHTAERNGYMLAGGRLGIMPGNLSKLMNDYGIEHHRVDPWELDQSAKNGEIADGTKFVVAVDNSGWPELIEEMNAYYRDNNKVNWSYMGMHNYEAVYVAGAEKPWVVYNAGSHSYQAQSYLTLQEMAGHRLEQYNAIYEVKK